MKETINRVNIKIGESTAKVKQIFLACIYPFGVIGISLIVIVLTGLILFFSCQFTNKWFNNNVVLALTTGVIASALMTIILELQRNREKSLLRMSALREYFRIVCGYYEYMHSDYEETLGQDYSEREYKNAIKKWEEAINSIDKDVINNNDYTAQQIMAVISRIESIRAIVIPCVENITLLTANEAIAISDIQQSIENMDRYICYQITKTLSDDEEFNSPSFEHVIELLKRPESILPEVRNWIVYEVININNAMILIAR